MGGASGKEKDAENVKGEEVNVKKVANKRKNVKLLIEELDDHEDSINCMQLSDDGSLLVTGGEDNVARMWSTKTLQCECLGALEGHTDYITCIAIIDTFVLTGSADNSVRKWDMTTCECMFVYEGHQSRVNRVICTGQFIFTTSYDKTARLWIFEGENLGEANADKACINVYKGHSKGVYPLVFIPAEGVPSEVDPGKNQMKLNPGDLLITGSADCTARSWSVDSAVCLKVFEGHTMPIMCMAVDHNGQILMTAGGDNVIRSWEIGTGMALKEFVGHSSAIIALQVVNRMLYSCSCDQTVRAWVIEFGDCTKVFKGHEHSVTCAKYVDGLVVTGCGDGVGRVFDAKSGSLKLELKGHSGSISAMAMVDGRLYTSCVDGKLRVWDLSHLVDESSASGHNVKDHLDKNNKKLKDLENKLDGYMKDETADHGMASQLNSKLPEPNHKATTSTLLNESLHNNLPGVIA